MCRVFNAKKKAVVPDGFLVSISQQIIASRSSRLVYRQKSPG